MNKPVLLDTFCKAGGCTKGYQRAGFYVVGIDIEPQKNYCGDEFIQSDALEYLATADLSRYAAIHASPPCQIHSRLKSLHGANYYDRHEDLIEVTRNALIETGKPYVIENVPGAPLCNPVMLCGAMFGLKVYRHRLFESNVFMLAPVHVPHNDQSKGVGRGMSPKGFISVAGTGGFAIPNGFRYACEAMGISWMTRSELAQAIPPAYTEWIGKHLMESIRVTA